MTYDVPYVYVLTPLTRISSKRRTVLLGFDMERRTVILLFLGVATSLPFMLLTWWLLGYLSLLFVPATTGAAFYSFSRSGRGLKQTQLQTRVDRFTSRSGQFILCGRVISPRSVTRTALVLATAPVARPARAGYFPPPAVPAQRNSSARSGRRTHRAGAS
jgi:hypothetical protein